jgi:TRAP-type C4-dicarboxylate transport system permease large subunit
VILGTGVALLFALAFSRAMSSVFIALVVSNLLLMLCALFMDRRKSTNIAAWSLFYATFLAFDWKTSHRWVDVVFWGMCICVTIALGTLDRLKSQVP